RSLALLRATACGPGPLSTVRPERGPRRGRVSVVLAPVVELAIRLDYVCGVLVAEVEHPAAIVGEGGVCRGHVSLTSFETTAAELGGTFDGAGRALDCVRHDKSMGPPLPPRNPKTTRPGRFLSVGRYWRRACAP